MKKYLIFDVSLGFFNDTSFIIGHEQISHLIRYVSLSARRQIAFTTSVFYAEYIDVFHIYQPFQN